ncbi:MAG: radical SAM protein [Proteobacteria bacterium]|nr:radical SAM protein [Pseudomonadota bacterium]MBU1695869.1 radical SAM protein [Pseudomonadota bacterium]
MSRWITKILDKIGSPELDWIQVEVSTRCNAACIYCPQPLLYKKQNMRFGLFKQLIPYLGYTNLVYLQGWGEPLLNPDIFDMIRVCKAKGKRVGFTTNGMLLNKETICRLVDLETDILSVSLAGTSPATHNRIRRGTDLVKIIENLDLLQQISAQKGALRPALHLAYLMWASNFHELQEVVQLAKKLGAKQIVCSNMTLIMNETLCSEAIFTRQEKQQYFVSVLEAIAKEAQKENLIFAYKSPVLLDKSVQCSENICYSCVVNVTGEISPCVFTSPSLAQTDCQKSLLHIFQNHPSPCYPLSFGNIGKENLSRIWNKKEYHRFRRFHDPDITKTVIDPQPVPESCMSCYSSIVGTSF